MAEPAAQHAPSSPWLHTLGLLWEELPGLVSDRVELLSLELHRAGLALMRIVVLMIAASILGVTAWLALWSAAVMALVAAGLPPALALGCALLVNVAAAAWAVARARRLLPLLRLPATRRHLMIHPQRAVDGPPLPDVAAGLQQPLAR
jgi:uncharacterized membrane protein YqjE